MLKRMAQLQKMNLHPATTQKLRPDRDLRVLAGHFVLPLPPVLLLQSVPGFFLLPGVESGP